LSLVSGNRLYQTLGNLKVSPLVGIAVPDFETSNVLYITGTANILIGSEASSLLTHSNLAVQINVTSSRFVKSGLPFKGIPLEYSPYNPPVRHLLTEQVPHVSESRSNTNATLSDREVLTPTINRYTFTLTGENIDWQPGQHITLDFEPEIGLGYSHMREDDPQSLNDDFVRTFTISNEPQEGSDGLKKVQITARKSGPATSFLARHNLRVPLEIPVLGFGGEASFRLPTTTANGASAPVYIAGGVGITPLLAQAKAVLAAGVPLSVVWSLNKFDVNLAIDAFERVDGLARVTTLHVTGGELDGETVTKLQEKGVLQVKSSRIDAKCLEELKGKGNKFYLCAGPKLLLGLQRWLDGEDIVWEDFGY
jgi:ferredoxin-NADP reductase